MDAEARASVRLDGETQHDEVAELRARVKVLEQVAQAAEAALDVVQWSCTDGELDEDGAWADMCPRCSRYKQDGHSSTCEVANAMNALRAAGYGGEG